MGFGSAKFATDRQYRIFISDVRASGFCASGGFEWAGAKFASDGKWAGSPRLRLDTSLVCDTLVVFHHLSIP